MGDTPNNNQAVEQADIENVIEREIESPLTEIDEPPSQASSEVMPFDELPAKERKDLFKWTKNFDFLKLLLALMTIVYIIDVIASKGQSSLKEPLFEVLKTLLLTAAGYIFAKSESA